MQNCKENVIVQKVVAHHTGLTSQMVIHQLLFFYYFFQRGVLHMTAVCIWCEVATTIRESGNRLFCIALYSQVQSSPAYRATTHTSIAVYSFFVSSYRKSAVKISAKKKKRTQNQEDGKKKHCSIFKSKINNKS